MYEKHNRLTQALLMVCLAPGIAMAEPALFGKANLSLASLEDDNGDSVSIASHSSRVGVKGNLETESSLQVGYRFVWQIDMADNSKSSADHVKSREQFISLKDSWGEVRIGRHDTPYKKAGKKSVEFFSDSYADWNNIITKDHDKRADSSISYYNAFGPVKFSAMYAGGKDAPANENAGDILSTALDMKFDDLVLAVAYQDIASIPDPVPANTVPATQAVKLVVGYTLGGTNVGIAAESIDEDGSASRTNTMLSLKHKINKGNTIKFTYGTADATTPGADDPTMTAIGIDHKLNASTTAFAYLADGSDDGLDADAGLAGEGTVLAVGAIVKF